MGQLDGKRKIAMLGDMLELGEFSEEHHREIGRLLVAEGYDQVYTLVRPQNLLLVKQKRQAFA